MICQVNEYIHQYHVGYNMWSEIIDSLVKGVQLPNGETSQLISQETHCYNSQ